MNEKRERPTPPRGHRVPSAGGKRRRQTMDSRTTTTLGGLRGLLAELERLHAAGEKALLGVVVATEGSTYQKPGALVLLDSKGLRHGVISGGCLEPELEQRACAVFAAGCAALADFDTRSDEDLVFGSGTGCRGRVHLLLLPQPPGAPLARALGQAARDGVALHVALNLDASAPGSGSARIATNSTMPHDAWRWGEDGAETQCLAAAAHRELVIVPPPRILLLGAGPETPVLLELMQRFGWYVDVVEHRQRWSAFARQGQLDDVIALAPAAAAARLQSRRANAAIAMSHNYTLDLAHLRFCARSEIPYIGLLGPPARRDALLDELGDDAERVRARLHAPVGLDLGGSGPEVIALAIVAELQQFFARRRDA
jgi:xanthine dehydrogenase accessory factor